MFCLATNKVPLGDFRSAKNFVNLTISVAASRGAFIPPLNRKSSDWGIVPRSMVF